MDKKSAPTSLYRDRRSFAKIPDVMDVPNLIAIQTESFDWFKNEGLAQAFADVCPIENNTGDMCVEFGKHEFGEPKYTVDECKEKDVTYQAPLFVEIRFINRETGEIKEQEVFMGDFPLMTNRGTFIINGTERVVVSQLVRSPGVYFGSERDKASDKTLYNAKVIPSRGAWLEFETDKRDILSVRIDRKRKQPATLLVRALGLAETREEIIDLLGSDEMDPRIGLRTAMLVCGVCLFFISMFCFKGFMLLEPNEARVVMFFGKYKGTFYETGFWWINPFMGRKKISVRARNLNVEPIKVNDKNGNPVMIGLVLVWKIRPDEIYRAVFDIDASTMGGTDLAVSASARMKVLENFVSVQSDAALRQVAGYYAYDNNGVADDELTLRSNSDEINDQLEAKLNDRLSMAGIEVIEARINYLAYAPEIAAVMLRRQQADAIISAREKIVEGAVTMVKMALDRLADDRIVELDEERKAAMVSNLLVVLCADEAAQPIVNAGTLHH